MRAGSSYSLFDAESIWSILMRIAPPVMLAQLIQAMYNIVDSYFVGQFSNDGLTALSIVYPVQLIVTAIAVVTAVWAAMMVSYHAISVGLLSLRILCQGQVQRGRPDVIHRLHKVDPIAPAVLCLCYVLVCDLPGPLDTDHPLHLDLVLHGVVVPLDSQPLLLIPEGDFFG